MTCEYVRACVQRCSERFKSTLSGYGCGNGAYENGPGLRAECAAGPSCGPRGLARTDLLWNPPHTCFLPLTPCRPTSRLAPHSSCTRAAQPQSDAPGPGSPARPEQHGAAANCMRSDRRTGVRRLQLAQRSRKRPQHSSGKEPHPGADTGDSSLCTPITSSSALAGRQIAHPAMFPAAPTGSLFLWLNTCEDLHAPLQGALQALPPPRSPHVLSEALGNPLSFGLLICEMGTAAVSASQGSQR